MASRRTGKRPLVECLDGDDGTEKLYRFQILLPNGTSTRIILRDPGEELLVDEFIYAVRKEVEKTAKSTWGSKRKILWNEDIYLEDMSENRFKKKIFFNHFKTNKCHILRLHDGAGESVNTFQNMWDLTPDTDLLAELPAEYTFETAIADLIDNSLQAVWANGPGERKLVRVTIDKNEILIFDSGPGMDGSDENSIVKWGKMGSSNHRPSREVAIGGKPPYLRPFFGMFGYGGAIASMHLGRRAIVSAKTKDSKKVYTLHLEREALLKNSSSECIWKTDGGIRDPLEEELRISPHGSFTQVEIQEPKFSCLEISKIQCMLKDIYFPYIQCDEEASNRNTRTPIEFQVNGTVLAEIEGGEVAITNLHSSNGPDFILQLKFLNNQANSASKSPGLRGPHNANARLRCVYFPIVEGKESIDGILEKLEAEGCGIAENFENFSRVSIRRLGRLLPDARWERLPFMISKLKKGDKAQLLRRCSMRVKCFVETDAGFLPTPSKTDLAHHDLFSIALKNFGSKPHGKEPETVVEIYKDGKSISILQLEKEYQDWIFQMHDKYDEEVEGGEDEPILVVGPCNKKRLGISSDVVRVHQVIRRKGMSWKSGQKVKILKGAVGFLKNNFYAILEYILLDGFQGDAGGEARLICRPLGCSKEQGCLLLVNDGNASLNIRDSVSFPISVIDSGKCEVVDVATWNIQVEKRQQKAPSMIDVLSGKLCCQLEIDGELPVDVPVSAGYVPPDEIVAVIRPANFTALTADKYLDQKYIIKDDLEMSMEVKYIRENYQDGELIFGARIKPSSRKGLHGLYIFTLRKKYPKLFCKAGAYTFSFSVICRDSSCKRQETKVTVRPSSEVGKWRFSCDEQGPNSLLTIRVGKHISRLSVTCHDIYSNQISFSSLPEPSLKIKADEITLVNVNQMKMDLSQNRMTLEIMVVLVESNKLDMVRPHYEAALEICSMDKSLSATIPCKVFPGTLHSVGMRKSMKFRKILLPGCVMEELVFEMFDAYSNHVEEGTEVCVEVDGFCFQDRIGSIRKVNDQGLLVLSGLLKVVVGYGRKVHLSIYFGGKMLLGEEFEVEKRELRAVSGVPGRCTAGSQLENITFEIFDSMGVIDKAIHGQHHTLTIMSDSLEMVNMVQYTFQHGRCIVPVVPIPRKQGIFHFIASHTHHPELCTNVEVYVVQGSKLELVDVEEPDINNFDSQFLDRRTLLLQDSSQFLVDFIIDDARKLYEDIGEVGLRISNYEVKLKVLNDRKAMITKDIYHLQDSLEPQSLNQIDCLINPNEQILKNIKGKEDTAAAVFCYFSKAIQIREPQKNLFKDVVGLVALLATVTNSSLSRIFAEYLGENYMLAIVCKSYKAASDLENYGEDGKVNRSCALHKVASTLGLKINRRFFVICLDEIRPYPGVLKDRDTEGKLSLPDPLLPSGNIPPGFMGYAVNLINLDIHHLHTRTSRGYGLRETLFYCLFGELQVYRTREDMRHAKSCIKYGAVSLDGGIMRGNGIIFLGDCEPEVKFPVLDSEAGQLTPRSIYVLKEIEDKKVELADLDEKILEEEESHKKALAKFKKKSEQLRKFLEDKKPLANLLEYRHDITLG